MFQNNRFIKYNPRSLGDLQADDRQGFNTHSHGAFRVSWREIDYPAWLSSLVKYLQVHERTGQSIWIWLMAKVFLHCTVCRMPWRGMSPKISLSYSWNKADRLMNSGSGISEDISNSGRTMHWNLVLGTESFSAQPSRRGSSWLHSIVSQLYPEQSKYSNTNGSERGFGKGIWIFKSSPTTVMTPGYLDLT